ncbi:MAG TPA: hypothetical protein VGY76_10185 [Solirubrobacteraceae bacterium]|nr:hypothetical protein [Solirubrobacteraceae bacterium]
MSIRRYDSLAAVYAALEAGGFSDFEDRLPVALALAFPPYKYDDVIIGGRYFAVGAPSAGRERWTVLEAQPDGGVEVATISLFRTREAAQDHARWLAAGPHPAGLSPSAILVLDQLAEVGADGGKILGTSEHADLSSFTEPIANLGPIERAKMDWLTEAMADFEPDLGHFTWAELVLVRELRCHGFTLCRHLDDMTRHVLHSDWLGYTGPWSEDWHIVREKPENEHLRTLIHRRRSAVQRPGPLGWRRAASTSDGQTRKLAEGLSATKTRAFLETQQQQGQSLRLVTVESSGGLRKAEDFLRAAA